MWPFRKREPEFDPDMELMARKTVEVIEEYCREKNISEPVRAIAQAMRERPKSFRIVKTPTRVVCGEQWTVTDRRTGLTAHVEREVYGLNCISSRVVLPFKITTDESAHLWTEGKKWLAERQQRAGDYRNAKRRREWSVKYGVVG